MTHPVHRLKLRSYRSRSVRPPGAELERVASPQELDLDLAGEREIDRCRVLESNLIVLRASEGEIRSAKLDRAPVRAVVRSGVGVERGVPRVSFEKNAHLNAYVSGE